MFRMTVYILIEVFLRELADGAAQVELIYFGCENIGRNADS